MQVLNNGLKTFKSLLFLGPGFDFNLIEMHINDKNTHFNH